MKKQRGFTLVEVCGLLLLVAFFVGWVINVAKFIGLLGGEITTWFVARAVGIFIAPLGGILGFF